jgi:uncharacterized protein (TIGR04255 family)
MVSEALVCAAKEELVSRRGSRIPKKLKHDAIVEALFELRFDTATSPEFLFVRLSEFEPWKPFNQSRLPAYSIPEAVRKLDQNLRFQPIFELIEPQNQRSVRIGPNVLSYHLRSPYVGWAEFSKELANVVNALFMKADRLIVTRLGLRYLNALNGANHGIHGLDDLDLSLSIGGERITGGTNLNVWANSAADISCMVRIATPQFVTGSLPAETTVLADIDVFTPDQYRTENPGDVLAWTREAHDAEKREFFVLLTDQTITNLTEET